MHLNPYGEYAVLLVDSLAHDRPDDRAGIEARTRDFGMTMGFSSAPDDHARTRILIADWLRIVDADSDEERTELLNAEMAVAAPHPRLVDHDDEGWHLHYRDQDQSLAHVLQAVISVGTAFHLSTRGMHRLRRCADSEAPGDPCRQVVVDVTRNGRQRYCCVCCANRDAMRRHRARHR